MANSDQDTTVVNKDAANTPADKLAATTDGSPAADVEKKSASKTDVLKAWKPFVGSAETLDVETFENVDGGKTTRLFNKFTNSTVAEAHGDDALLTLYRSAGLAHVEDGKAPADDASAEPHPMPASGVTAPKNQVVIDDENPDNPGTTVAKARKEAGLPVSD